MPVAVPNKMFTANEIRKHRDKLDDMSKISADFLDWVYADHLAFFNRHGFSKYYGERKKEHRTRGSRITQLKRFGKDWRLVDLQVPTACVVLAMQSLEKGFNETGQSKTWDKIEGHLGRNGLLGTDLQQMLQQLGWKIYYWNPDPDSNEKWDKEDKRISPLKPNRKWNPVWGGHAYRYATSVNKGKYYKTKVDNATKLVGFGSKQPAAFKKVPIYVGIAHAGYHVFPGMRGRVVEAHSTRVMTAKDNIEVSEFNPLARGGGPRWTRSEKYRSGLIAVPEDF